MNKQVEDENIENLHSEENGAPAAHINKDSEASSETPAEDFEKELEKLKEEIKNSQEKYLRTLADLENLRRRSEKEKSDIHQFSLERLLKDVLPVLDSFDQSTLEDKKTKEKEDFSNFVNGISLVKKQLIDVLSKHGLESISAIGQKFDPNLHQAIQQVESTDAKEECVQNEFAKGYTLNGRLLRPTMVSVAIPKDK